MELSTYKALLCKLDEQIYKLVQSFCRSEVYGYAVCKEKLHKLIQVKKLLEKNFNLKELNNIFYKCYTQEDGTKIIKKLNKIIGNKAEIIVKTITKTTSTSEEFRFELPTIPHTEGFYIYSLWINCQLNSEEDVNKVLAILEKANYLGFYNFQYDANTNEIYSNDSYVYTETFSYEYQPFDVFNTLQCLNEKSIKRLIENY